MKRGFTLVELSIVLVIIGLLIGGILVAQSMISTTKIVKTIHQMEQYRVATNNFQTTYKCLPGDCAANLGFVNKSECYYNWTSNGYNNGDGDGKIGTRAGPACSAGIFSIETYNYWAFLEQSGHLPALSTRGTAADRGNDVGYRSSPTAPVITQKADGSGTARAGGWWVFELNASTAASYTPPGMGNVNVFFLGNGFSTGGVYPAVLGNKNAVAIDSKLDDGLPLSGNVQAVRAIFDAWYSVANPTAGVGSANCVVSSQYKLSGLTGVQECSIIIKADF